MPVSNPTSLVAAQVNNSATSLTSGSFTPTGGALLIVTLHVGGNLSATLSISDTAGLSWTQVSSSQSNDQDSIFYAVAPASPSAMTVTVSQSGAAAEMIAEFYQVTGQGPVGATGTNVAASGTSLTVTLSAAPASTSLLFGMVGAFTDTATTLGTPTGWTGFTQQNTTRHDGARVGYINGSGAQANAFSNTTTAQFGAVIIEITAGGASGTASLSLGASGAGAGKAPGGGSLTLGAPGAAAGNPGGNAAMDLQAGGSGNFSSGTAQLNLTGQAVLNQWGNGVLTLGTGTSIIGGKTSGHATLSLSGTGTPIRAGGLGKAGIFVGVLIDFSGTPYGGIPTWTDVTGYVLTSGNPINITWGRQDWASDVSAATCNFQLDNRDGRFTPGRSTLVNGSANPNYPNVKRRVRTRITVTVGSTTVYCFDGLIDSWETTFQDGMFGLTTVAATDMLGRMGTDLPLRAMGHEEILVDAPTSFWPLNDQGPNFGDIQNVGGVLTAMPGFTGLGIVYQNVTYPPNVSTTFTDPDMVGAGLQGYFSYINCNALATPATFVMHFSTINTSVGGSLITDSSGNAVVIKSNGYISTSLTGPNVSSLPVNDGKVHQVALQGGHIFVDTGDTGVAHGLSNINTLGFDLIGTVFNVATFPTLITQSRMFAYYVGAGGWGVTIKPSFYGERTSAHAQRLLTYRTNFGSLLDVGDGSVGVHSTAGSDLQQALYDTADAEGSVVFADGQGRVVFFNRSDHMFAPPSVLTLDAAQGEVEVSTVFRDDIQFLLNEAAISIPSGATQRYFDPTSQANDGVVAQDLSLIIDNEPHALAAATWRVQVGTQEQISAPQLDVNLFTVNAATVLGVLQLQPTNVVTLANIVQPVPTTERFMVQGGTITLGVDECRASLVTTVVPAGAAY